MGDNFSIPVKNREKLTFDFIKSFEYNLRKLSVLTRINVRNRASHIVNKLSSYSPPYDPLNANNLLRATKQFLKTNSNLIITRADKGNITVTLDKNDYILKIEEMLKDRETYTIVKKNLINKLISGQRDILKRWRKGNYITEAVFNSTYCTQGSLPKAYGFPKIHKDNCPFKIIISSIESPLYSFSVFLHKIMFKSFPKSDGFIKNSFQLVNK